MHPSVVVDASVWVSRLMLDDANHQASVAWSDRYILAQGILVAPEFVVVELAATLSRITQQPTSAKQAAMALYNDFSIKAVDTTLLHWAIDTAANLRLKAGDAIYIALAHQLGIPLISLDKEQLARAAPLVETFSPDIYPF